MITRQALQAYLDHFLGCAKIQDYAPNGLQVEGKSEILTLCSAVSADLHTIESAAALKADALLVHHGYFWKGESPVLVGHKKKRIAFLLKNEINLFAYHLPLDIHPTLGNNILLANLWGLKKIEPIHIGQTPGLLLKGQFETPMTSSALTQLLHQTLNRPPLHVEGESKTIQTVALCSGAAQDYLLDAKALGVDAYISGEISERTYYEAKESGLHYFSAGHHATECFGVQALGQHLAHEFNLTHHFLDSKNPI